MVDIGSFTVNKILQEVADLTNITNEYEPLIKKDWYNENFTLPFNGFTKDAYPKVILFRTLFFLNTNQSRNCVIENFQEFSKSMEKLRLAYYTNTTNASAIKDANIALMSDSLLCDSVLKSTLLQATSKNNDKNKHKHRNTFLFR